MNNNKLASNSNSNTNSTRQIPHHRIDEEETIYKKYELGRKLGQGSFGVVYEIKNRDNDRKFAIKMINKEKAGKAVISFENEVFIMKSVTHPNLIKLEEVYESKKKLYIITELCEAGELAKWLKKNGPMKEDKSKIIMRKIVDAISYLHKNEIVHRDLKLENILIKDSVEDVEYLDIKITDFGLSSQRQSLGTDSMFEEYCGTPLYMAPEIIDNFPYSQLCDVWALGIIMFIILTSQLPFTADTENKLREQIRKAEINTNSPIYMKLSPEAKDCLSRMFKVNPAYRITSRELFSHPWFLDKKMSEIPEQQKNVLELMSEMLKEQETNSAIQAQNSNHLNGVPTPSPRPNNDNSYNLDSKSNLASQGKLIKKPLPNNYNNSNNSNLKPLPTHSVNISSNNHNNNTLNSTPINKSNPSGATKDQNTRYIKLPNLKIQNEILNSFEIDNNNNYNNKNHEDRKIMKNHDIKAQQIEMNRKKYFFNSSLYHLVKNKTNKSLESKKFVGNEEVKELKIKKAPIISSPSPSSISTTSSKIGINKILKDNTPPSNYKLPFIRNPMHSEVSSNRSNIKSDSSTVSSAKEIVLNDDNNHYHYTSYLCNLSNDSSNSTVTTKSDGRVSKFSDALTNRSTKVSFKFDK